MTSKWSKIPKLENQNEKKVKIKTLISKIVDKREKINKAKIKNKPIKQKDEFHELQNTNIKNKRRVITINSIDIKKIIKENYKICNFF